MIYNILMIYSLFGVDFFVLDSVIRTFFLCSLLGVYIRFLLAFISNERWLKNYSQIFVFTLLPVTGYLITSVISNNIALSLGMVGALSIVRFRTPVKNPSELVTYFVLITIGIVVNVDGNLAINFTLFLTIAMLLIEAYKFMSKLLNIDEIEFNDSNNSYLKINSINQKPKVEILKELTHKSYDGNYLYIFASRKREKIFEIENMFDKEDILSLSYDFEE
jgi:hypothetical protein